MIERRRLGPCWVLTLTLALVLELALALLLRQPCLAEGSATSQNQVPRVPAPGHHGFLWATEQLDGLVDVMSRWSRHESLGSDDVKRVFAAHFDPRFPQETVCIRAIESGLVEHLEEQDPRHMLPLVFWQVEMMFLSEAWSGASTPETQDFDRVADYLVRFHEGASKKAKGKEEDLRIDRTTQLGYLGVGELYFQRGSPVYLERADQAFDLAVKIDRGFEPARYWSAFLKEKIRAPVDVLRAWRELAEDHPDDPEYRLRFGLVARRAERSRKAAELLATVAQGDRAPDWMRLLAYEEWVQVLLEGSDRDRQEAKSLLDAARREVPGHSQLDLLAIFLRLPDDRREALRLAEQVEARRPEAGPPPRIRYELAQAEKIDPARDELIQLLTQASGELTHELERIHSSHVFRWHVPQMCRPFGTG